MILEWNYHPVSGVFANMALVADWQVKNSMQNMTLQMPIMEWNLFKFSGDVAEETDQMNLWLYQN